MSESPVPSRKLPPTERDFEIYEEVHIQQRSTWQAAVRYDISQTRVRQIIRRVVEWLSEVLPPQAKVAREQELYLARQIAADRFQHQLEEVASLWQETREPKYAGIRLRLTTAQARLGVVGGVAAGLAADATAGIPVPAYQPPPERIQARSASEGPGCQGAADADEFPELPDIEIGPTYPADPIAYRDITEEDIAAREAAGYPFPYKLVKHLYEHGYLPKAASEPATPAESNPQSPICNPQCAPPPPGDFSAAVEGSNQPASASASPCAETAAASAGYGAERGGPGSAFAPQTSPAEPLLTAGASVPVNELKIDRCQPGAVISERRLPSPPAPASLPDSLLPIPDCTANNG
jgi:hypothetical protein